MCGDGFSGGSGSAIRGGKKKRRVLTATGHRQRAERYRILAMQNLAPKIIQELMCSADKHEAIAEELEKSSQISEEYQTVQVVS